MNRAPTPCYLCQRFHRRPDAPPGQGYCEGYERFRRHEDTNEACPLFNRARNEADRRAWAEQQTKEAM